MNGLPAWRDGGCQVASVLVALIVVYPVVASQAGLGVGDSITARWEQSAELTDVNGTPHGYFGSALALDGTTLVVGTAVDQCDMFTTVHVYKLGPEGPWTHVARLVPSDGEYGEARSGCSGFGFSVAVDEVAGVIAVGNPGYNKPGDGEVNADALDGAVYVYERTPSGEWVETAKMEGPDDRADALGAEFGRSVAVSGDTLVVGAPFEDRGPGLTEAGAAYVYVRDDTGWKQTIIIEPGEPLAKAAFGLDVALGGADLVVGAPGDRVELGSIERVGAAYAFHRTDGDAWAETSKLVPPDPGAAGSPGADCFGVHVAVNQGTVVVGDSCWDSTMDSLGLGDNTGRAYVFETNGTAWVLEATLSPVNEAVTRAFGSAVSTTGDVIVVGAEQEHDALRQGAAYVFERSEDSWVQVARLAGRDTAPSDQFGEAAAVAGGLIIVGAPFADDPKVGVRQHPAGEGTAPEVDVALGKNVGKVYVFAWSETSAATALT